MNSYFDLNFYLYLNHNLNLNLNQYQYQVDHKRKPAYMRTGAISPGRKIKICGGGLNAVGPHVTLSFFQTSVARGLHGPGKGHKTDQVLLLGCPGGAGEGWAKKIVKERGFWQHTRLLVFSTMLYQHNGQEIMSHELLLIFKDTVPPDMLIVCGLEPKMEI